MSRTHVLGMSEWYVIRYDGRRIDLCILGAIEVHGRRCMCVYMNFGMCLDSINSCTLDRNCQHAYSPGAIWMDPRGHRVCGRKASTSLNEYAEAGREQLAD